MLKVLTISFLLLLTCFKAQAFLQDTAKNKIDAVEVKHTDPLFGETIYRIYYVNNFFIYQNQYHHSESEVRLKFDSLKNEFTSEDSLLLSEKREYYFVYHKDSSYGYRYDPKNIYENHKRFKVDSALKGIRGFNNYENFLEKKPDSCIWNDNKTALKEVYLQAKTNETPSISIIFYYSKNFNYLKETFNAVLDSNKKMKLYKIEILLDEFYSEKDKKLWPKSSFLEVMSEYKVQNPDEILQYIRQYNESITTDK